LSLPIMTHALTLILSLLAVLSSARATDSFFINTTNTSPVPWKTSITLRCLWDTTNAGAEADFFINEISIYSSESPYDVEGVSEKATLEVDMDAGEAVLTINDLMSTDNAGIKCYVSRKGTTEPYDLLVLEPPSAPVADIAVSAVSFTSATVTFSEVENASEYTIGIEFDGQAEWTEFTTSDLSYTLENLVVATSYSVRVKAGNDAGYRDGVELETQTFKTLDNRPCTAVNAIAVGADTAYDASVITVTWALDSNTVSGLVIDEILVKAMKDGVDVHGSEQILAGNATEATFTLPGAGVYSVVVSTHNEYVAESDTVVTIIHEVKETTAPPPTVPVVEPVTEEPVEEEPEDNVVEDEIELVCSDPNAVSTSYTVGQPIVMELIPGHDVKIECFLSESSSSSNADIVWKYEGGSSLNQTQLVASASMSLDIETDVKKSIFQFEPVLDTYAGIYTCELGGEMCEFQITLTDMAVGASATHCISTLLFLAVVLHLLY